MIILTDKIVENQGVPEKWENNLVIDSLVNNQGKKW